MYRYISLVWNEADGQAREVAKFLTQHFMRTQTVWEEAYSGTGLYVLHTGEEKKRMQAYPLCTKNGGGGVVLGKLFDRPSDLVSIPENAQLSVTEARDIIASKGRYLVDKFWGNWVAFFQDENKKYVLVEPISSFPCYRTSYRGVDIYFTYMPDVAACPFLNFSIDWMPIARNINYTFDKSEAGLREIETILPGQCLSVSPWGIEKTYYWNPQQQSQTDIIEDPKEAEIALRQVLQSTVAALVAPYNSVLHELGGLDSSIILACLKQAPNTPDITCINIFHENRMGDERYFTRKATAHFGVPLVEYLQTAEKLDIDALLKTPLVSLPYFHAHENGFGEDKLTIAKGNGCQVLCGGAGGDEILGAARTSYGAVDYLKTHGLGKGEFLRHVMQASRIQKRSVRSVCTEIFKDSFSQKQWCYFDQAGLGVAALFTPDVQDYLKKTRKIHPWVKPEHGVLPGKLDQIISYTTGKFDQECNTLPEKHLLTLEPYITRPVVDLCLRIPSWVMTVDGKTRGLARKAFQQDLPPEITWRESKMAFDRYPYSIVEKNLEYIKGLLLDGLLVKEGIANKAHLEKMLHRGHDIELADSMNMKWFLDAELWSRKWRASKPCSLDQHSATSLFLNV